MMNRRDFLRRAALITTGAIAADQLELLERLTHRRRFFPGAEIGRRAGPKLELYDARGRLIASMPLVARQIESELNRIRYEPVELVSDRAATVEDARVSRDGRHVATLDIQSDRWTWSHTPIRVESGQSLRLSGIVAQVDGNVARAAAQDLLAPLL